MSYIVFARKYRPQSFDEIIGQPHITTTLKNAIAQDRVAHAYIFAGPRGVGKTTTARILAKALNCEKGPTPTPCNACITCTEITQGTSLDILEIDGASNRGIDEIRNLRENVKFSPSKGKFKVYIIDEVHMLTPEAFNALLKTLEEPPPHAKFIFATTQAHKVPATILSRCQRFDFRRISIKDIVANLKTIAEKEQLQIKEDALILIAKYCDGSMRDAQVILDQIASFTEGKAALDDVSKILGVISDELLFDLADSIKEKNPVRALKVIDQLIDEGKDVVQVILHLIEHFRNLAVVKVGSGLQSIVEAAPEKLKRYEEQAKKFTIEEMLYIIYTFSNTLDFVRKSHMARVPFETAMIKLTREGLLMSSSEIIERLDKLEEKLRGRDEIVLTPLVAQAPKRGEDKKSDPPQSHVESDPSNKVVTLDEITGSWNMILSYIKTKKMPVALYLQEGYPINVEAATLLIAFPKESQFHKDTLEAPEYRRIIEEAIKETVGAVVRVKFILVDSGNFKKSTPDATFEEPVRNEEGMPDEPLAAKNDIDPIVQDALEIFGGEVSAKTNKKERAK